MGWGRAERPAKFPLWWNPLFRVGKSFKLPKLLTQTESRNH